MLGRTIGLALVAATIVAVLTAVLIGDPHRAAPPETDAAVQPPPSGGAAPAGGAGLPDLTVTNITVAAYGPPCQGILALYIDVSNVGDAAAGPFHVTIDVTSIFVSGGLDAGSTTTLTLPGSTGGFITVDSNNVIVESNESNNTVFSPPLPTPSPVPTCTPIPPTPTFTPTPTASATPCVPDGDGDGVPDCSDNCPTDPNPGQDNNDRNFIDNSPPYQQALDDRTRAYSDGLGDVCDPDDDNDGIPDVHDAIAPCPTPTPPASGSCGPPPCSPDFAGTNALLADTDGDRFLDGAECALGADPANPGSKPALASCAAAGDFDGDRISDRIEYCFYNTSAVSIDTDGDAGLDGATDGCEVASLNGDRIVNSLDQGMLAQGIIGIVPYTVNVDLNKDGVLNSLDQGRMASFIVPPGQCPGTIPDLTIKTMRIELETGSSCNYGSTTLGVRVIVRSADSASPQFIVEVNGVQVPLTGGIPANSDGAVWVPGYEQFSPNISTADITNLVLESNEMNNSLSQFLPVPTLPPTCTPTPTATSTPTATPT